MPALRPRRFVALALLAGLAGCAAEEPAPAPAPVLQLDRVETTELPGWNEDQVSAERPSCKLHVVYLRFRISQVLRVGEQPKHLRVGQKLGQ